MRYIYGDVSILSLVRKVYANQTQKFYSVPRELYFNKPQDCSKRHRISSPWKLKILTSKITGRFSGGLRRVELSYPASKTVIKAALRVCRFPLFPSSPTPNAKTELWRGKMGEAESL